jgi:hypothetical protein
MERLKSRAAQLKAEKQEINQAEGNSKIKG